MDVNKAIAAYIDLRAKLAVLEKEHKAKVAKIKEIQGKIQAKIQEQLDSTGADSMKATTGTAFRATKDSVRIANKADFMAYVTNEVEKRGVDGLYMLTVSASKSAVKEYMEDNEDELPPGVKYEKWQEIQIRSK